MVATALLVALTIVFQQLRFVLGDSIVTTYIIGSLVNLCLIVAAVAVGLWSGIAVAVISPLIAFAQGHLPLLQMLPWVMAGNAVLVVFYALFAVKDKASLTVFWPRWAITGVVAAAVKFAVIALGQTTVLTSMKGLAFSPALSAAASAQSVQLITAGVALVLSGIVLPMLPKRVVGKTA
jgi:hypothetical protein